MDAEFKMEQIGTLFVWVGALEGGFGGEIPQGCTPQKVKCLQKNVPGGKNKNHRQALNKHSSHLLRKKSHFGTGHCRFAQRRHKKDHLRGYLNARADEERHLLNRHKAESCRLGLEPASDESW